MAKQASINEIKGTIGELTYYKNKKRHSVRRKSSLNKNVIMKDPRYLAMRQNMAEFGTASRGGKWIRYAISNLLIIAKDSNMIGRLVSVLFNLIKTDRINGKGSRSIANGDLNLLKGFNFNLTSMLRSIFKGKFTCSIDRKEDIIKIDFESFVPSDILNGPKSATHFKIVSAVIEVDFDKQVAKSINIETDHINYTLPQMESFTDAYHLNTNSRGCFMVVIGIQFFQLMPEGFIQLKDKKYNPLEVIDVYVL